jgi:hypothetical protein
VGERERERENERKSMGWVEGRRGKERRREGVNGRQTSAAREQLGMDSSRRWWLLVGMKETRSSSNKFDLVAEKVKSSKCWPKKRLETVGRQGTVDWTRRCHARLACRGLCIERFTQPLPICTLTRESTEACVFFDSSWKMLKCETSHIIS